MATLEKPIREEQNLTVRLRKDQADRMRELAKQADRSLAAELRVAVRHYLAKHA